MFHVVEYLIIQILICYVSSGDATEEDEKAQREWDKAQYEEKKRQRALEEEQLRAYKPRTKQNLNMNEAVEVVE